MIRQAVKQRRACAHRREQAKAAATTVAVVASYSSRPQLGVVQHNSALTHNAMRGPSCRNGVVRTVPNSTDRPGCPRSPPRPHPPAGARSSSSGGCRCPAVPGRNVSPGAANGGRTSGPGARPIGGGGTLARIFTRAVRRIAQWSINLILRRTEEGSLVIKLGGFI